MKEKIETQKSLANPPQSICIKKKYILFLLAGNINLYIRREEIMMVT